MHTLEDTPEGAFCSWRQEPCYPPFPSLNPRVCLVLPLNNGDPERGRALPSSHREFVAGPSPFFYSRQPLLQHCLCAPRDGELITLEAAPFMIGQHRVVRVS